MRFDWGRYIVDGLIARVDWGSLNGAGCGVCVVGKALRGGKHAGCQSGDGISVNYVKPVFV